eukprot:scaffold305659_cov39-Tisochrysis_lutea.AAC.4
MSRFSWASLRSRRDWCMAHAHAAPAVSDARRRRACVKVMHVIPPIPPITIYLLSHGPGLHGWSTTRRYPFCARWLCDAFYGARPRSAASCGPHQLSLTSRRSETVKRRDQGRRLDEGVVLSAESAPCCRYALMATWSTDSSVPAPSPTPGIDAQPADNPYCACIDAGQLRLRLPRANPRRPR